MILLSEQSIREQLSLYDFNVPFDLYLSPSLESTNSFLKNLKIGSPLMICCAEQQTKGRGRFERHWYSPFGKNICFSCRLQLACSMARLKGLSLIVGMSIVEVIKTLTIQDQIFLKWPNDILWNDKKLSGILIESISHKNNIIEIVIGVGLNVNSSFPPELSNACSLIDITQQSYDRNLIVALIIVKLHNYLQRFLQSGMSGFLSEWQKLDYLKGKIIKVSHQNTIITGLAVGIDTDGALILKDETNKLHHLFAGDTSLHLE